MLQAQASDSFATSLVILCAHSCVHVCACVLLCSPDFRSKQGIYPRLKREFGMESPERSADKTMAMWCMKRFVCPMFDISHLFLSAFSLPFFPFSACSIWNIFVRIHKSFIPLHMNYGLAHISQQLHIDSLQCWNRKESY